MVQVKMFSKILVFGEERGKELWSLRVMKRWKESRKQRGSKGFCKLERQEPSETSGGCGHCSTWTHTCAFNSGVVETTEIHNRSLQDKRSYNYNFGL